MTKKKALLCQLRRERRKKPSLLPARPPHPETQDVHVINTERNTPLHWAALNGHARVAEALVRAGANASALNAAEVRVALLFFTCYK